MSINDKYYAIECTLSFGVIRYFCCYWILDEREVRLCKEKSHAIFYTTKELAEAELELVRNMELLEIKKYKFIIVR